VLALDWRGVIDKPRVASRRKFCWGGHGVAVETCCLLIAYTIDSNSVVSRLCCNIFPVTTNFIGFPLPSDIRRYR
jgi:hypothetical protein